MPPLSIMIKPASSLCNMRCKYCFYHSLAQSRESFSYGIMDYATADAIVGKALKFADGQRVYFAFQGGEPLMAGLDYFKHFVEQVKKENIKQSEIIFSLQTNGTLVDEEWADFFTKHKFLIGLSIDGNEKANKYRTFSDNLPTFSKVYSTAELFLDKGVEFNCLIVTTGYAADHIEEIYKWFFDYGFKYLQFIPCLRPFGDKSESELFMTVDQYGDFLIKLFNLYVKDYVRGNYTSVRLLDNLVYQFLGRQPEQCGVSGHCSHQFVVEGNGNVYPCDFYCLDEWLLGNIANSDFDEMAHGSKAMDFLRESLTVPDKCKACKYFGLCRAGGCKRSRADRDYCQAYKRFFDACLPLFRVFVGENNR